MKKAIDVMLVTDAMRAVRAISEELKGKLDALPYGRFDESKSARRNAVCQLEDYGFRVRDDWRGTRLGILGIHSTCTGGVQGAMRNWLRAAEAKIGATK